MLLEMISINLLSEKQLDRVFFSPAATMEPGGRTPKYSLEKDNLIVNEKDTSEISVEDYVKAMLDELETAKHNREYFTIGYYRKMKVYMKYESKYVLFI